MAHDPKAKLAKLIDGIQFAMLTTLTPDGELHSRPMATHDQKSLDELWFFTYRNSGKVHEIDRDHHVNLAYADPDKNRWVSVAGQATVIEDVEKARELWSPALKAWFPDGPQTKDLALLKVVPESAEYWDSSSKKMVKLFGLAKAVLSGERYDADKDENDRVDLGGGEPAPVH